MRGLSRRPEASSRLPLDTPQFTGRAGVLTTLDTLLMLSQQDRPRGVIVEGMPGVGKTALAIHWAHTIEESFPDGYLYLDLRGDGDGAALIRDEVLRQALITLGIPSGQLPENEDARATAYREKISGKKILIILDNVHDEGQVKELLPSAWGPLTLMTSRNHLRELASSDKIMTIELGVLTPDESVELLTALVGEQRIADEPGAAKELAEVCGYLPLALRIVAANLARDPEAGLPEAVRDLEQAPLSALTLHDNPNITVRATLDLSYRGLDGDLRRTFRMLGLFEGHDISVEAAAAILDVYPEDAHQLLAKLRLANLIERTAPGRYRFHDLLRDYARERSGVEEEPAARQAAVHRLLTWYLTTAHDKGDFLGQRRRRMEGLPVRPVTTDLQDRENRLVWLEIERENLLVVTKQAASVGEHRLTWEIADAVYDFFKLRSYTADNIEVHRLGLTAAQLVRDLSAETYMRYHLSVIYRLQGQYRLAVEEAEQALTISRRLKNRYLEAAARNTLAEIRYVMGQYTESLLDAETALTIREEIGDRLGEAETLNSIGRIQRAVGRYSESFHNVEAALAIRQEIHDSLGEAEALDTLARLYRLSGAYTKALESGYKALKIRLEHGDRLGEGESLQGLARVHRRLGDYSQAEEYAIQALNIMEKVGSARGIAEVYATLGDIYLDISREPDALESYDAAIEIRTSIGDRRGISESLLSLARAYRKRGEFERSLTDARRALDISGDIGDRFGQARALDSLARTYQFTNQYDRALEYAEEALEIQRNIDDRRGEGNTLENIAEIYRRNNKYAPALAFAKSAHKVLVEDGDQRGQASALESIALVQLKRGRPKLAIEAARKAAEMWAKLGDHRGLTEALDVLVKVAATRRSVIDIHLDGESRQQRQSLFYAFVNGFGGIFDFFDTAQPAAESLPSFESTLATDVHALCLAHGLIPEDHYEHNGQAAQRSDAPE